MGPPANGMQSIPPTNSSAGSHPSLVACIPNNSILACSANAAQHTCTSLFYSRRSHPIGGWCSLRISCCQPRHCPGCSCRGSTARHSTDTRQQRQQHLAASIDFTLQRVWRHCSHQLPTAVAAAIQTAAPKAAAALHADLRIHPTTNEPPHLSPSISSSASVCGLRRSWRGMLPRLAPDCGS
jgi:hypothetical protein